MRSASSFEQITLFERHLRVFFALVSLKTPVTFQWQPQPGFFGNISFLAFFCFSWSKPMNVARTEQRESGKRGGKVVRKLLKSTHFSFFPLRLSPTRLSFFPVCSYHCLAFLPASVKGPSGLPALVFSVMFPLVWPLCGLPMEPPSVGE